MENPSLCDTCIYAPTCNRYKNVPQPVLYCEDYKPSGTKGTLLEENGQEAKNKKKSDLKGLCSICQNRKYCHIKVPEGGIWHCDHFN